MSHRYTDEARIIWSNKCDLGDRHGGPCHGKEGEDRMTGNITDLLNDLSETAERSTDVQRGRYSAWVIDAIGFTEVQLWHRSDADFYQRWTNDPWRGEWELKEQRA